MLQHVYRNVYGLVTDLHGRCNKMKLYGIWDQSDRMYEITTSHAVEVVVSVPVLTSHPDKYAANN